MQISFIQLYFSFSSCLYVCSVCDASHFPQVPCAPCSCVLLALLVEIGPRAFLWCCLPFVNRRDGCQKEWIIYLPASRTSHWSEQHALLTERYINCKFTCNMNDFWVYFCWADLYMCSNKWLPYYPVVNSWYTLELLLWKGSRLFTFKWSWTILKNFKCKLFAFMLSYLGRNC